MSSRSTAKGSLRLPFAAWTLLAVTLTAAAGCADVSGQALQQDVAQLRQDLNSLTLAVHRGRGDTETVVGQLDRRTREQSAESSKQSAALNARLDALVRGGGARLRARRRAVAAGRDPRARRSVGRRRAGSAARALRRLRRRRSRRCPPPARSGGASAEESYQAAYLDFSKGLYPARGVGLP